MTLLKKSNTLGFTLVELLIALALIGLIMLLLFSGLRLGGRTWETVEATAERAEAVRLAHGVLVRLLTQMRSVTVTVEEKTLPVFGGDGGQLEFAAPLSDQVGIAGLYVLRLTLETHNDAQMLVLTRWLLHPDILRGGDGFPAWQPLSAEAGDAAALARLPTEMDAAHGAFGRTPLLTTVQDFAVAYYGTPEGETEADWHEDWFEQAHWPLQVRVHLTAPSQMWPDVVVNLPQAPE